MSKELNYNVEEITGGVPVKMWTKGVPVEDEAKKQLANAARLPIVFKHVAVMPDVHLGIGATIGSVIPTIKAIIPAAVGVDIGCGMMAAKTTLRAEDLPDNLGPLRSAIEKAVPHGFSPKNRGRDNGAWDTPPELVDQAWSTLVDEFNAQCEGGEVEIGFNNRYLLDALRNARTEQVKLEISGPLSPVKVLPTEGSDFLYLVLPVRFKND